MNASNAHASKHPSMNGEEYVFFSLRYLCCCMDTLGGAPIGRCSLERAIGTTIGSVRPLRLSNRQSQHRRNHEEVFDFPRSRLSAKWRRVLAFQVEPFADQ